MIDATKVSFRHPVRASEHEVERLRGIAEAAALRRPPSLLVPYSSSSSRSRRSSSCSPSPSPLCSR